MASKERSAFIIEDKAKNNRKRGIKSFVYFVIILIIAAAAYYFYSQNKEKIDSAVSEKYEEVSEEVSSTKDAFLEVGHKNTPKDSQYRRDREAVVKGK